MSFKPLDDRQVVNRAALPTSIGSAAGASLDVVLGDIDSKMVNLNGTQTLTNKTLSFLKTNVVTDSTTTGSAATLQTGDIAAGTVRLTNTGLSSVSQIPAGVAGQYILVANQTGNTILLNNSGTSPNGIFTGTGSAVTMLPNSSFLLSYDAVKGSWMLAGGSGSGGSAFKNALINGAFDIFQNGFPNTAATGTTARATDRWIIRNNSGSTVTASQTTGVVQGSKYGCSFTYGTGGTTNSASLEQIVENNDSLRFLGQDASFGVWIKALGNTNQVTLKISYNTSESRTGLTTIATQNFTVNSSTFTFCSMNAVPMGTAATSAGVVSVAIAPGTASSGNAYDSGNGFVAEQAMFGVGDTLPSTMVRAGNNYEDELKMCQRFYFYAPYGSSAPYANVVICVGVSEVNSSYCYYKYPNSMRAAPTITFGGSFTMNRVQTASYPITGINYFDNVSISEVAVPSIGSNFGYPTVWSVGTATAYIAGDAEI